MVNCFTQLHLLYHKPKDTTPTPPPHIYLQYVTAAKISVGGVQSVKSSLQYHTLMLSAPSSLPFSRCLSGRDCLLFQSWFTSTLQLLASLTGREVGKAELG